jgi:hypothetical protein
MDSLQVYTLIGKGTKTYPFPGVLIANMTQINLRWPSWDLYKVAEKLYELYYL